MSCSVLGGYVAAWLAKHDELLNGALSAWLSIAFGIGGLVAGTMATSTLTQIVGLVISPIAGLAGGYLRLKRASAKMQRA